MPAEGKEPRAVVFVHSDLEELLAARIEGLKIGLLAAALILMAIFMMGDRW